MLFVVVLVPIAVDTSHEKCSLIYTYKRMPLQAEDLFKREILLTNTVGFEIHVSIKLKVLVFSVAFICHARVALHYRHSRQQLRQTGIVVFLF